jgi:hypothetical protein
MRLGFNRLDKIQQVNLALSTWQKELEVVP